MSDNKALLERVWLAGFMASGQGFNGEYPYDFHPDEDLMQHCRESLAEFLSKEAAAQ